MRNFMTFQKLLLESVQQQAATLLLSSCICSVLQPAEGEVVPCPQSPPEQQPACAQGSLAADLAQCAALAQSGPSCGWAVAAD